MRLRRETPVALEVIAEQLALGTWANVGRRLYEATPYKAWVTPLRKTERPKPHRGHCRGAPRRSLQLREPISCSRCWRPLIPWWNGYGKMPTNRTRQMLLDIVMPWNRFLSASLRVGPNRVAPPFADRHAPMLLQMAEQSPPLHASSNSALSA